MQTGCGPVQAACPGHRCCHLIAHMAAGTNQRMLQHHQRSWLQACDSAAQAGVSNVAPCSTASKVLLKTGLQIGAPQAHRLEGAVCGLHCCLHPAAQVSSSGKVLSSKACLQHDTHLLHKSAYAGAAAEVITSSQCLNPTDNALSEAVALQLVQERPGACQCSSRIMSGPQLAHSQKCYAPVSALRSGQRSTALSRVAASSCIPVMSTRAGSMLAERSVSAKCACTHALVAVRPANRCPASLPGIGAPRTAASHR